MTGLWKMDSSRPRKKGLYCENLWNVFNRAIQRAELEQKNGKAMTNDPFRKKTWEKCNVRDTYQSLLLRENAVENEK